jgi:hypothetical protein
MWRVASVNVVNVMNIETVALKNTPQNALAVRVLTDGEKRFAADF